MREPIREWIICTAGYLQKRGDQIGVPAIDHDLYQRFTTPTRRVCFFEWNSDWSAIAEWIWRLSMNGGDPPTVMCVNYSWGVGYGLVRFAREMKERGLQIQVAVCSDGVAHVGPRILHKVGWSQFRAYWPILRPSIKIPNNVRKIHWFIQRNSALRGHELIYEDTGAPVGNRIVESEGRTHHNMDESPDFRQKAMEVAIDLFGG